MTLCAALWSHCLWSRVYPILLWGITVNWALFSVFLHRFNSNVSWYTLNLDLPPNQRWTHVIKEKKAEVSSYMLWCFGSCLCISLSVGAHRQQGVPECCTSLLCCSQCFSDSTYEATKPVWSGIKGPLCRIEEGFNEQKWNMVFIIMFSLVQNHL